LAGRVGRSGGWSLRCFTPGYRSSSRIGTGLRFRLSGFLSLWQSFFMWDGEPQVQQGVKALRSALAGRGCGLGDLAKVSARRWYAIGLVQGSGCSSSSRIRASKAAFFARFSRLWILLVRRARSLSSSSPVSTALSALFRWHGGMPSGAQREETLLALL